jgi:hypothetical protein
MFFFYRLSIYLVALLVSSVAADCELEEKIKQLICVLNEGPVRHFISTTESSFLPFLDCPSKTTFDSLKLTVERKMQNIERDNREAFASGKNVNKN